MSQMVKGNTSLFQEALKYHQDGNLADAETLYNEILETQQENIDTIFFLEH